MPFVSPPELIRSLLLADVDVLSLAGGGVTVGPATATQIAQGAISLAMLPGVPESTSLVVRGSLEASCQAPTVSEAEEIGQAVYYALHDTYRRVVPQSNGHSYLVHFTQANGPVLRQSEDGESWDVAVMIAAMIGTQPVS